MTSRTPEKTDTHMRPEYLDQAEADKFRAEADKLRAEAVAGSEKAAAEARKAAAEADAVDITNETARIQLAREHHKRRKELAADEFHHTYLFDKQVDESSVKACIRQLADWERTTTTTEPLTVELQINSPGGGIFEGFALIDYIAGMHTHGHRINTTAYGMAASMGGVLLQIGKTRRMGASAALLIHEAQFRVGGKTGAVEDEVKLVHMLQDRILDLYAERAKGSAADKPLSRGQIANRWHRTDWWIGAADCLKHGFVDQIV